MPIRLLKFNFQFACLVLSFGLVAEASQPLPRVCASILAVEEGSFFTTGFPFNKSRPNREMVAVNPILLSERLQKLAKESQGKLSHRKHVLKQGEAVSPYDSLDVFSLGSPEAKTRILITAGIHGNEGLGSVTSVDLIESLLRAPPEWLGSVFLTVIPMVSPRELHRQKRKTKLGVDRNRIFRRLRRAIKGSHQSSELSLNQKLQQIIKNGRFTHSYDLHQAPSAKGFFVVGTKEQELLLAKRAILSLDKSLIHPAKETDWRNKRYNFYEEGVYTSQTEGTLKLFASKQGLKSYTLEAPGTMPVLTSRPAYLKLLMAFINGAVEDSK